MGANINGLPVHIVAGALAYVKHTQLVRLVGRHPLLGLGHAVTTGAHPLMEGNGLPGAQKLLQLRLIVRHRRILIHLEYAQWKNSAKAYISLEFELIYLTLSLILNSEIYK